MTDLFRNSDPETSHQVPENLSALRRKVLIALYMNGPMTDLDINNYCSLSHGTRPESTYRKRRCDLCNIGLAQRTGITKHQRGRNRIVWELTPAGKAMAYVTL